MDKIGKLLLVDLHLDVLLDMKKIISYIFNMVQVYLSSIVLQNDLLINCQYHLVYLKKAQLI